MKKKEIKDEYPKKVCHMPTRHVKKSIPEEGMPHSHKESQKKKKKKKKIARIQEKKWEKEGSCK